MRRYLKYWRKRVRVERTIDTARRQSPVLKTGGVTGPPSLPQWTAQQYHRRQNIFSTSAPLRILIRMRRSLPMPQRTFRFVQLDVFTSRPLEGNQLAVFSDARGLSDGEMQKLARETNLSETTFILPRDAAVERREGHKVRIFTVNEELPFAGHPTLGTAWYLRQHSNSDEIVLDLKVGDRKSAVEGNERK